MTKRRSAIAAAILTIACRVHAADDPPQKPPLDKLLETPVSTAAEYERVLSSTAAKYDQSLANAPASMTVITAEEIERYGWTTLDQVLQSVPGFYLTNDRSYTTLGVRGIGRPTDYNSRIMLLIDGHTINEPVIGGCPLGADLALDLRSVAKIEIVRGPGSALYGSHAMHAVINVITRGADEMDGISAGARVASHGDGTARLGFGHTFGSGLQMTVSGLWQGRAGANLYFPEYDAPETNRGIAEGRDYERRYGLTLGLRKGNLSILAMRRSRTKGIPTGSYESLFDIDSRTTDWEELVGAKYSRAIGANKIVEVRADWNRSGEHGLWPYDPAPGVDDTFGVRLGGEARLHWDMGPHQRLTAGVEYTKVARAEYKFVLGDYETNSAQPYDVRSYYAEYNYRPTPRLGLVAGIRHDDFSSTADSTNPRAAILFTPNESTTLKLLYGTAFRSPNVYEAFYADPVTPWKANPNLQPERIRTIEMEWEQRLSPQLFAVGSLYRISASGLIDQQLDPADQIYSYANLGQVSSNGGEMKLDLRRPNGVWAYVSYSFAETRDQLGHISNSPHHLAKAGISTPAWNPLHFGIDTLFESARFSRDGQRGDSFFVVNGTMSRKLDKRLRLGFTARNLFNSGYATPVGPELRQQTIRQDGRTLAMELTFSR